MLVDEDHGNVSGLGESFEGIFNDLGFSIYDKS